MISRRTRFSQSAARRLAPIAVASSVAAVSVTALPAIAQDAGGTPTTPTRQPSAAALPEATVLFQRHADTVGGMEALDAFDSRLLTGSFKGADGMSAFVTMYYEKPERFAVVLEIPGMGTINTVYDGEIGWRQVGANVQLVEGPELVDLIESADYYGEVNWKSRYRNIRTVEVGALEGVQTYRVAYESVLGKRGFHFFNDETGLFVGTQTTAAMEEGQQAIFVRFDDFEEHDGILMPMKIIQQLPGNEVSTFSFNAVDHETKRPDLLARPAELKRLLAARKDRESSSGDE